MHLEDLLVMEVPTKALQHVSSNYKLKPGGSSVEHYAKAIINNQVTLPIGENLANSYRFAGKTAVSLYQPISGLPKEFNNKESVKNHLINKYGKALFENELRPELSETPKLFKVYESNNKLVLAFTFLGRERRFLRNYRLTKEQIQYLDYIVLHFGPLIVEFRSASTKIPLFKKAICEVLGLKEGIDWFNYSELSKNEAEKLKADLGCSLTGAKHKMTEGIYDTIEVKANTNIEDLFEQEEYRQEFSDKPYKSMTFRFPFNHNYGLEETISMKISQNGVSFNSTVSEEIIDYVIKNILSIKVDTFKQIAASAENIAK